MLYVCGNDRDFDGWAAKGNTGWAYNDVLPFFKRAENNSDFRSSPYHGTSGPLTVGKYPEAATDSYAAVMRAGHTRLGYAALTDFNARQYNGHVEAQGTIKNGTRVNAARAYLFPNTGRKNLYIMRQTIAQRIIFNGTAPNDIGVNVRTNTSDCDPINFYARKEVIVSAGAIGSPKLLLLSGIGRPADILTIPLKKSLAVGYNLQDHVTSYTFIKINNNAPKQGVDDILWDAQNYLFHRTGPFTSLGSSSTLAFLNTTDPAATYADCEYIHYRFMKSQEFMGQIMANFAFKDSYIKAVVDANADYEIVMVMTTVLNPVSKGRVRIATTDVRDAPIITPNYFDSSIDVDTMVRGLKKLNELVNTPEMQAINASFVQFAISECDAFSYLSDDYWKCYIKYVTNNEWHACGTCKMGPSTDPEAVVGPDLRVYGIPKLRVVDVSIFPDEVSSNTQCTTYMVAEKGAYMIKQTYPTLYPTP